MAPIVFPSSSRPRLVEPVGAPESIAAFILSFVFMVSVGLRLSVADFRSMKDDPGRLVAGVVAQALALPVLTLTLLEGLGVDAFLGAGVFLISAAPSGSGSNVLTVFARGNVPLSLTLSAMSSAIACLTIPALVPAGMDSIRGGGSLGAPVGMLAAQVGLVLLAPVALGMLLRTRWPEASAVYSPRLQTLTVLVGTIWFLGMAWARPDAVGAQWALDVAAASAVWASFAMALGACVAASLRLRTTDRATFAIEFAARNAPMVALLAVALGRAELAIFGGAYASVGYPIVAGVAWLHRRRGPRPN